MAVYKLSDVLECIQSMKKDGFEYIEITEADDDDEPTLCIEAIAEDHTEEDFIDSVSLPSNYTC